MSKKKNTHKRGKKKRYHPLWIWGGILLTFCMVIGVLIYYKSKNKKFYRNNTFKGIYVDKNKFPITGIDISKHSGNVDFNTLQNENVDFIYIKATEGLTLTDRKFERNYREGQKTTIPIGAYHFLRFNSNGKKQAQNFLNAIKGKEFDLPLVLDVESWTNVKNHRASNVKKIIRDFLTTIRNSRSEKLMIYTNENGYKMYIHDEFEEDIWICSFNHRPKVLKNWVLWQHIHDEKMNGVAGFIDLNTFNGTRIAWEKFLKRNQK